jgi:hypothetical protein
MLHVVPRNPNQDHLHGGSCWCEPEEWESPEGVDITVHRDATPTSWTVLQNGEPLPELVFPPPNGDPDAVEVVRAEHRGWVIQRFDGLARYENDPVAMLAVEDDEPRIGTPSED